MGNNASGYEMRQARNKQEQDFSSQKKVEKGSSRTDWLPGVVFVFLIGLAAYGLSRLHHSLDALAMAIIIGITVRIILGSAKWYLPGVKLGLKIFIPLGIILYGSNLGVGFLASLPSNVIFLTLASMGTLYVVIMLLNRLWKVSPKTGELIADGSAICGSSAIAVISPAIEAEPKDTAISLLVVATISVMGAMIYPILKELLNIPDAVYAVLSGATLHQTGIVRIAVGSMESEFATMALTVKSIRIFMLLVFTVMSVLLHNRSTKGKLAFTGKDLWRDLRRVWFFVPFFLMSLFASFPAISDVMVLFHPWAAFIFSMALACTGLLVDIESVLATGTRPLIVGLVGWILVVLLFLLTWPIFF